MSYKFRRHVSFPQSCTQRDLWGPRGQLNFDSDLIYEPPVTALPEDQQAADEEAITKRYISVGVGWVSLIAENLLCHPFIVLRRQCQIILDFKNVGATYNKMLSMITYKACPDREKALTSYIMRVNVTFNFVNNNSRNYHLVPQTLIPVIIHLHQRQGITTLWKGLGSVLLIRGLTLAIEDLLSKITPWPKEIDCDTTLKSFFRHVLLKCVSLAIVTPFYSASLVETVQSDIASEKPGLMDVFREGASRLVHWGFPKRGRLLPIWALILPTVAVGVARYLFYISVRGGLTKIIQRPERYKHGKPGAYPKDIVEICSAPDYTVYPTLITMLTTDMLFFPFETVVHRLHLQGTRTIIDNLDNGYSVIPILTNYEGPFDCYDKCLQTEGTHGLFKGFGAMMLQYIIHLTLVRGTKFILTQLSSLMRSNTKPVHRDSPPFVYGNTNLAPDNYSIP